MSWLVLQTQGWAKHTNQANRTYYTRPNGTKVSQKRDLTQQEKGEIGHILFPNAAGRKRKTVPPTPDVADTVTPGPSNEPLNTPSSNVYKEVVVSSEVRLICRRKLRCTM